MPDIYTFINNGNQCYFITALQLFLSSDLFKIVVNSSKSTNSTILCLKDIINSNIVHSNEIYNFHSTHNPYLLKQSLGLVNDFFKTMEQQDTWECFLNLLEEFSKLTTTEYVRPKLVYHSDTDPELYKKYIKCLFDHDSKNKKSYINEIFLGCYEITKVCVGCRHKETDFEIFFNIDIVPIDGMSVLNCISKYFETEKVERNCEKCHDNRCGSYKKLSFMKFPKTLILCIRRYDKTHFNAKVNVDKSFSIRRNDRSFLYTLNTIVHHTGRDIDSGHYYITKDDLFINDSNVSKIQQDSILKNSDTAYILTYDLAD